MKTTPLESWISRKIGDGSQKITRHKIEAHQLKTLRKIIEFAKEQSSFYRTRLAGFTANELCRLKDLECLPFTTAEDIRRNPLALLCVSQSEINRVVTLSTSGTMGSPKRIYFTSGDQELTIDFFHHGMSTLTNPGDKVLVLLPGDRPGSVGDLLAKGLGRLGAVAIAHGPVRNPHDVLRLMEKKKIDCLVGIPVEVLSLVRHGSGLTRPVRNVLLSADYVSDAIANEIRRTWGCELFTHYGMTEMGWGGGVECRFHFGYHLREADLLFEIVDPETGNPVEDGNAGEIVFTTLTRRGMPLIRYRTGDISRFILEKCPCGTVLKSMERVGGRSEASLNIGSKTLSMADLDERIFPLSGVLDFSAVLIHRDGRDRLQVNIHMMEGYGERTVAEAQCAVESISALQPGIEEGRLSVDCIVGPVDRKITGKRRIADLRQTAAADIIPG